MDSVAATQTPFFTLCKTLNSSPKSFYLLFHRHLSKTYLNRGFQNRFSNGRIKGNSHGGMKMSKAWFSISLAGTLLRNSTPTVRNSLRLACISSSAALGGGGGGDGSGGAVGRNGGNGGGDGSNGESGSKSLAGESEDGSALSPDVIILDVGGMSCGGCASSVKRILESQPLVSSATVNLTTETAIVWATPEAQLAQNWKQHLGEKLASHLTSCGFKSNLRTRPLVTAITDLVLDPSPPSSSSQCPSAVDTLIQVEDTCLRVLFIHEMQQLNYREHLNFVAEFYASAIQNLHRALERKRDEKLSRLKDSGRELAVSWALCTVCLLGHASHLLGSNAPSWIHAFHSTGFHMSLSLITLLGPGRQLILDGLKSLWRGAPNMNTLVGLGALSSFTVSSVAALIPELGWKSFFEEPIMLLAFVLLGRNLEQRAKLKAASDMTGLLSILPKKARLVVDGNAEGSLLDVPCNSLSVGDKIVVLPGDRVPADGIVRAGRSTVDESSFTGEPLPVTKLPGAKVTAGSININGTLTVEVRRPGGETVMGDIVRLVEEAQNEKVPVQRLADKVAGHFTYGVMALSAVTFMFWNTFGSQLLPAIIQHGSPVSLALQLSCSVLVIACPCALGLATPTAVLVGTSLGATRGLLLRGGNILEKFASVDTIVFDKTGTLTVGRPVVTKVVVVEPVEDQSTRKGSSPRWSELEILRLAAGVESNTNHPIGKAILEAARAADCQNVKVMDGTFKEEPGSGAMAIIEQRKISVGTSGWLQRHGVGHHPFPRVVEFKNQSVVYIGVDGDLAGLIYFEDKIRSDAGQVVESLSKQGISIYMLSGDKKHTAEYVASVVGIHRDKVISGVKPDEKKKFVCELQKEKKVVAMVGDGINDAAALASSDIGIAMGGGVGAASEVSSVVLMGNKLSQLLDALELSRLTMKTIKQNLWWAFAYNIAGIPIAAGLLLPVTGTMLTPSIAGALMGLSSMGVMANSLFLRLKFDSKQKPMYTFSQHTNTSSHSDLIDQNDKSEKIYSAKWSST